MNENEIHAARTRAYHIWENKGRPEGEHDSHWQQALRELGLLPPFDDERSAIAEQARKWDEEEGRS